MKQQQPQKNRYSRKQAPKRRPCDIVVGQNIQFYRTRKQMTYAQLARKIGVSDSGLYYMEYGYYTAKIPVLMKIAKALDCSVVELVSGLDHL